MHRFRKKSETRRQTTEDSMQPTTSVNDDALQLPALPPASDFRTSLILPSLTRRFTLLRSYNGDPVALEDLKTKFAEQRARGAVNQVSEEEEGMILEALGKMHFTSDGPDQNSVHSTSFSLRDSSTAASMATSPLPSPKSTRSTKRYSNNLFGSGKFRDHSYMRNAERLRGSNRSALSFAPSEQSTSTKNKRDTDESFRPTTPESSSFALSPPSTPNDRFPRDSTRSSRSAFLEAPSSYASDTNSSSGTEFRLSKTFSHDLLKRASMALEDVIREIEEEAEEPDVDDDIVLLRSPSAPPQPNINEDGEDEPSHGENSFDEVEVDDYQPGTALSSDVQIQVGETKHATATSPSPVSHSSSRTTSPMPRLPGYIPGMQRPMTPHDVGLESEDQSSSTTPKATTPRLPGVYGSSSAPSPSVHERRDSNASTAKQLSRTNTPLASGTVNETPLFVSRSLNGRFTPEDRQNGESTEFDRERHISKRRLISPLSGQANQYITAASSSSSSIPSTASSSGFPHSNSTWQPFSTSSRPSPIRNGSGHSRNGSVNSLTDITSTDIHTYDAAIELEAALFRGKSSESTRSVRSPVLPDSPLIDRHDMDHKRAPSVMSGIDLGTPHSPSWPLRSPTPNGSVAVRTKSPTFSDNGDKTATAFSNGNASSANTRPSPKKHGNTESASSMTGFQLSLGSTQPLVLSPFVNSSRSSLESEGSSYHSWDEIPGGRPKNRVKAMFSKVESDPPEWHDLVADGSLLSMHGDFGRDEEVVKQLSGLGKSDFVGIQDKLVEAVMNKSYDNGKDRNDRASSALRKRRPSTSQSNYSASGKDNRVPSPSPAARSASPAVATFATSSKTNVDQVTTASSKANALLDSVVNSIQASPTKPQILIPTQPEPTSSSRTRTASEVSSLTRRNRNLADALFGPEGEDGSLQSPKMPPPFPLSPRSMATERSTPENLSTSHLPRTPTAPTRRLPPMGQMSSPNLASVDQKALTLEVQRKVEAATIALRKSPSNSKLMDAGTPSKRKIHRDQISSPTLVLTTTSVETIPLPSVIPASSTSTSSKLGRRFKMFTETLKYKPSPSGGEVTPFPLDSKPSTVRDRSYQTSSTGHIEEPMLHTSRSISTTDLNRSKSQLVSSTASSGPGLKGLMSRFRKGKNPDSLLDSPARRGEELHSSSSTTSFSSSPTGSNLHSHHVQSASGAKTTFQGTRSPSVKSVQHSQKRSQESHQMFQSLVVPNAAVEPVEDGALSPGSVKDEDALRQLYDAASNLGLDQEALNSLVARSTSTSSRSTTGKKTSVLLAPTNRQPDISEDAIENVRAPSVSDGRSNLDGFSRVAGPVIRKLSIKKNPDSPNRQQKESEALLPRTLSLPSQPQQQTYLQPQARQARLREDKSSAGTASRNTIIRRTIIMPSEAKGVPVDINTLLRKNSTSNRKRRPISVTSVQSKSSVQDRAPTPPPPKVAGSSGKRFSTDPPVPNLPHSFTNNLDVPHGAEKPSSPYDSFFDMYGGDSRIPSVIPPDGTGDFDSPSESGPALEVIELANGETIWSIVNGLRDDDAESFYGNRASFASEYSLREPNNDGVQVYFKEHGRSSSKGSVNSFAAKKRPQASSSPARPETKVFFSSSAHIGRLIENLSQGTDSGSFNILPNRPQSQSRATSPSIGSESEMRWTVEERLEHMLGSMGSQA